MRLKRRGGESGPPSLGQIELEALDDGRVAEVGRGQALGTGQLVEPVATVARAALHEGVAERADVAGGDPDLGVHEDARVEADDVVALLDHRPPPGALDVVLELDAQRPVVPDGVDATVDLGRGEDEAAALGERDDGLEAGDGGRDVIRIEIAGVGGTDGRGGLVGHGRGWAPATDAQGRPSLSHGRRRRRSPTGPLGRASIVAIEGPDGRLQASSDPCYIRAGAHPPSSGDPR